MARQRNIKPGYFANEDLAECSPHARLLFAGLWQLADRAGRLEDRPKKIRAAVFPYEPQLDIDALLGELIERGFIVRYYALGLNCLAVPNWSKHQNPHRREPESVLPSFEERMSTGQARPHLDPVPSLDEPCPSTDSGPALTGTSTGKGQTQAGLCPVLAPDQHQTGPAAPAPATLEKKTPPRAATGFGGLSPPVVSSKRPLPAGRATQERFVAEWRRRYGESAKPGWRGDVATWRLLAQRVDELGFDEVLRRWCACLSESHGEPGDPLRGHPLRVFLAATMIDRWTRRESAERTVEREGPPFERAYVLELLQQAIDKGDHDKMLQWSSYGAMWFQDDDEFEALQRRCHLPTRAATT